MIELQPDRMSKAIEKARRVRNHIKMIAWRKYEVRTPENRIYTVTFDAQPGKKLASCTCAAKAECYHIAGAVVLHIAIARLRADEEKAAQNATEQKPVEQKPTTRRPRPILVKKECTHADCKSTRCNYDVRIGGIAI